MNRPYFVMTAFAGVILVAAAGLSGGGGARAESLVLEGQAHVEDNETLAIWGQRIRLADVLVPDPGSAEGLAGKRFLERLVTSVTVRCVVAVRTPQAAMPGRCFAGGADLGRALVAAGHARFREQTGRRQEGVRGVYPR